MLKTYYYKEFTYKKVTYKFKGKLRVRVNEFLLQDLKSYGTEVELLDFNDGFSVEGTFQNVEKEIRKYLRYVFEKCLLVEDSTLNFYERKYKQQWIDFIKPPKEVEDRANEISAVAVDVSKKYKKQVIKKETIKEVPDVIKKKAKKVTPKTKETKKEVTQSKTCAKKDLKEIKVIENKVPTKSKRKKKNENI